MSIADGEILTSVEDGVYGSDVRQRADWGGADYSAWIDYSNSLPPGLLQRYYVYAQPTSNTDSIGTAISRIQIWRQSPSLSIRAFQLVWQRRILVLACNRTHGALHAVNTVSTTFFRLSGTSNSTHLNLWDHQNSWLYIIFMNFCVYKHRFFLLEQYLSGTVFLKPASTRILLPHSRRSSVTRPERCAPPPSSWYAKVVWRLLN